MKMTNARHKELTMDETQTLTKEERELGYHFCNEFDGLVVGPEEDTEWEVCSCFSTEQKAKFKLL